MARSKRPLGRLIKTLTPEETADARARMGLDTEGLRCSREDDVWSTLQREFPDWPLGDIKNVVGSVSPRMSADGRQVQQRYRTLMG